MSLLGSRSSSSILIRKRVPTGKETKTTDQIKYLLLLQVYFGHINSTLYLHIKKFTTACNTCVERILVMLNLA